MQPHQGQIVHRLPEGDTVNPLLEQQTNRNWRYWLAAVLHWLLRTPTRAFAVAVLPPTVILTGGLLWRARYLDQNIATGQLLGVVMFALLFLYGGFVFSLRVLRILRFMFGILYERQRVKRQARRAKRQRLVERTQQAIKANPRPPLC